MKKSILTIIIFLIIISILFLPIILPKEIIIEEAGKPSKLTLFGRISLIILIGSMFFSLMDIVLIFSKKLVNSICN